MAKIHKLAAVIVLGTVTLGSKALTVEAAEEPIAGITVTLDSFYESDQNAAEAAVQSIMEKITSKNDNLAFAQVSSYVNIRSKAGEDGEILGKLYDNSAATLISKDNGWYQIKSGSVTGYIKAEFLVTGEKASELAKTLGNRIAEVNTTTLKVRKSTSLNSEVLALVAMGDDYKVAKEQDGWVKILLDDNSYGYVAADYVKLETVYEEAVSIEEEQERLQEEAEADRQISSQPRPSDNSERSSASQTAGSSGGSTSSPATGKTTEADDYISDSSNSQLGNRISAYAVQFEGNPYVWGGTSLTNGADCSGFTQSVFAHFGVRIPRTSRTQATGGKRVSIDSLQPGDLVFYARNGTINHVAIYIGSGRVISASSPRTGIRITSYNYRQPYKAVRYMN